MGWILGSRFTIGHNGLWDSVQHHFWTRDRTALQEEPLIVDTVLSEQYQLFQVRAEKTQVLALLREDQLMNLAAWLQTNKVVCWYRAALLWCTYNNIALWRSPERTGKCRLCASGGGGVFVQPPTTARAGVWCRGVERADVIFQRGCCTPACFTFGLTRCESLQRWGGGVTAPGVITGGMWPMEGEL